MTINDQLVELGTLEGNEEKVVQRVGAKLVSEFFLSEADKQNEETIANVLYYLTDIQVRDYAMGLLNVDESVRYLTALNVLFEHAPTDTAYINAPACLLTTMLYEMGEKETALVTLSTAQEDYSLSGLLYRVISAGWPKESFQQMRNELHPKVVAGIFGEDE